MYILASFVEDKVSIGVWIYLWAFYFVPLIYISVSVPVPYCLDKCGFVVEPWGGISGQEEKGKTEDETAGWHH